MFVRKPLFMVEPDPDEPGGGGDPAPKEPDKPTPGADPDPDLDPDGSSSADDEPPFDAARALAKIKKANSENAALRKAKKAAEDKAQGLEPKAREADLQRVARRLGLPDTEEVDSFLDRLRGDNVDELAQDAERLLTLLAPKKDTERKPKEALRGGGNPDQEPDVDPSKVADEILSRGF